MSILEQKPSSGQPSGLGAIELKRGIFGNQTLAFAWSAVESAAKQVMGFALSLAVLAFVTPHDLGVYSLAFSILLVFALIVDDPIGEALIQRSSTTDLDWDTGFTINLAIAVCIFIILLSSSGLAAKILSEPGLAWAIPALATCILISPLGNIQKAHLARDLRFQELAKISLAANLAGGICALALAAAGAGFWALISNAIVTNTITTIFYRRVCHWRPRLRVNPASVTSLWSFVGQSFAVQCVLLLRESALPLLLGFFNGATAVGYFSLGLRISRFPGLFFEDLTRRPLLTVMSRLQHDPSRAAVLFLDVITIVAALAFPTFVGLALVGPSLTQLVFGDKWAQAGDLLPMLSAIVFGWLTLHVPAVALRARGDVGTAFAILASATALDLVIIVALLPFGMKNTLIAMTVRAAALLPWLSSLISRRIGVSGRSILARCGVPLLGVAAMTICILALEPRVSGGLAGPAILTIAGGLTYVSVFTVAAVCGDRTIIRAFQNIR